MGMLGNDTEMVVSEYEKIMFYPILLGSNLIQVTVLTDIDFFVIIVNSILIIFWLVNTVLAITPVCALVLSSTVLEPDLYLCKQMETNIES